MGFNMMQFAMQMIQKNPNVANNARNKSLIDILQSGDSARGEMAANNLLKTYGVNKEQALNQARQFFHL